MYTLFIRDQSVDILVEDWEEAVILLILAVFAPKAYRTPSKTYLTTSILPSAAVGIAVRGSSISKAGSFVFFCSHIWCRHSLLILPVRCACSSTFGSALVKVISGGCDILVWRSAKLGRRGGWEVGKFGRARAEAFGRNYNGATPSESHPVLVPVMMMIKR